MTPELLLKILADADIECTLEPSERHPSGRLLVFLPNDGKERERFLEIAVRPQLLNPLEDVPSFQQVQFETALPFSLLDRCASEAASFLHFLNRQLELPGFEMDEGEQLILYRYILLTEGNQLHPQLLKSVIGSLLLMLDLFGEAIEKVATGETTFDQILEKILALPSNI